MCGVYFTGTMGRLGELFCKDWGGRGESPPLLAHPPRPPIDLPQIGLGIAIFTAVFVAAPANPNLDKGPVFLFLVGKVTQLLFNALVGKTFLRMQNMYNITIQYIPNYSTNIVWLFTGLSVNRNDKYNL